ncbi:cytochrome c [Idiomarina sp. HP20-50]|uniref:cytochrome c n=1 Tax=Idiomarina sp. HP20-50 TaxID=3070813 RepID=UPI00294B216C|nr:cytochrome c [Idiomarina sp. HP20-50]MDV6315618.1 cytochrome c [Idiomarina sp. HP20-50]
MKLYQKMGCVGLILVASGLSLSTLAADPVTPKLTDKLSRLLKQEMRSIQSAMASIHVSMVTGEHELVATQAQQIHDSFIMKQSLTEQDKKDLMSAVPEGFVKLDKDFHRLAAGLAQAAKDKDTQKQFKLYNKMTGSCIACHSKYVSDRFDGLVKQ